MHDSFERIISTSSLKKFDERLTRSRIGEPVARSGDLRVGESLTEGSGVGPSSRSPRPAEAGLAAVALAVQAAHRVGEAALEPAAGREPVEVDVEGDQRLRHLRADAAEDAPAAEELR